MAEQKTVTLKYPVEVMATNGSVSTLTSVTVRRAKAKDLRHIPDSAFVENPKAAAVAAYCGIAFETAEEIDFEDLMAIMQEMPSLMPGFSGIGAKSSGESPESTTSLP
jgi:phosphotransacetylase